MPGEPPELPENVSITENLGNPARVITVGEHVLSDAAFRTALILGVSALLWLACADNDRPHDALPYYIGGNVNWNETNAKPIERAQELLNKYGELMVKKGLLAE